MSETKFPVVVYHPESKMTPPKTLRANNAAELEGLLRVGWKIQEAAQ